MPPLASRAEALGASLAPCLACGWHRSVEERPSFLVSSASAFFLNCSVKKAKKSVARVESSVFIAFKTFSGWANACFRLVSSRLREKSTDRKRATGCSTLRQFHSTVWKSCRRTNLTSNSILQTENSQGLCAPRRVPVLSISTVWAARPADIQRLSEGKLDDGLQRATGNKAHSPKEGARSTTTPGRSGLQPSPKASARERHSTTR